MTQQDVDGYLAFLFQRVPGVEKKYKAEVAAKFGRRLVREWDKYGLDRLKGFEWFWRVNAIICQWLLEALQNPAWWGVREGNWGKIKKLSDYCFLGQTNGLLINFLLFVSLWLDIGLPSKN